MSGPPDKWTWFSASGITGNDIGKMLNGLAKQGFTGQVVVVTAADGEFVYVAGYSQNQ